MPTRTASATWEGGLKDGTGRFEGESGAMAGAYSFGSRFEEARGSNPEELLAAAEAACYSMALSAELEKSGKTPTSVETQARCTIERVGDAFKITTMNLIVRAEVPGIDERDFLELAQKVKKTCPVSSALTANVAIEVEAKLTVDESRPRNAPAAENTSPTG
jgi:lipoyl-dependent peroxiredoxin